MQVGCVIRRQCTEACYASAYCEDDTSRQDPTQSRTHYLRAVTTGDWAGWAGWAGWAVSVGRYKYLPSVAPDWIQLPLYDWENQVSNVVMVNGYSDRSSGPFPWSLHDRLLHGITSQPILFLSFPALNHYSLFIVITERKFIPATGCGGRWDCKKTLVHTFKIIR
jgi:hypothetical protein